MYETTKVGSSYEIHDSKEEFQKLTQEMSVLRSKYELNLKRMAFEKKRVALVYDEAMMKHMNMRKITFILLLKLKTQFFALQF